MSIYKCPECGNEGSFAATWKEHGYFDGETGAFTPDGDGEVVDDYSCTECGSDWTGEELRTCAEEHEKETA